MIHPSQKISPKRSSNYTFYQLRPLLLHHTEENTEPPKSLDHEPLIKDMPMFIPQLFTEGEYMELGNVSAMPKEHKCICSRSEAFIPEVTMQVEGFCDHEQGMNRRSRILK